MKPIRQKRLEIMKMTVSEDITYDDDQLSTEPIRRKQLEIMKMVLSEDITHDGDQLSTKTTQDHDDDGIMEKGSLFEDITHDDDQLSTKTTQDHEDDGIMETEEDFEEKESFIRRHRVLYFIIDRECDMIYVSFRNQSRVLCFWGGFRIHLNKIFRL